jgi:uncharacterized repeat protein (TIGR03833 family)
MLDLAEADSVLIWERGMPVDRRREGQPCRFTGLRIYTSTAPKPQVCSLSPKGSPVFTGRLFRAARENAFLPFLRRAITCRMKDMNTDGNNRSAIRAGLRVRVVRKEDQKTGRLTEGIVADILTRSATHPHGIKVRLQSGIVGRVHEILTE